MKKKTRILILFCGTLLIIGILGSMWIINQPHGKWVEIIQNGIVLQKIDLSQTEHQIIEVEYEGRINRIQIEDGRIRVIEADCSDHTCVKMGWLDSIVPIVCLPNHLVIQFAEMSSNIDAVVQ